MLKFLIEEKGILIDDFYCMKDMSIFNGKIKIGKENCIIFLDIEEELRSEKEDMKCLIDELEKSFMKEKEMFKEKF